MDKWPQLYPTACNCQGSNECNSQLSYSLSLSSATTHKLFKNCLVCGLIYCTQNAKLQSCTFCSHSFSSSTLSTAPLSLDLQSKLAAANALKDRLLSADSDSQFKSSLLDTDAPADSLQFIPAGEMEARAGEFERLREKLERERAQRGTFNLAEMIFSGDDYVAKGDAE